MTHKVKLSVHFPLDPLTRSAPVNLYGRERSVEALVAPFVTVKYVDTYMLRSSDCYGYEGETAFDGNRVADSAKARYEGIKRTIEERYPQAIVSVVFTPTAPVMSFGPESLPALPRVDL
jgi:hypothetical protein